MQRHKSENGIYIINLSNGFPAYWTKYSRMAQVTFFKGYLPQILLGPFVETLSHIESVPSSAKQEV